MKKDYWSRADRPDAIKGPLTEGLSLYSTLMTIVRHGDQCDVNKAHYQHEIRRNEGKLEWMLRFQLVRYVIFYYWH